MKRKHIYLLSLQMFAAIAMSSCSEDLDSPVLPEAGSVGVPAAVELPADKLFGVWEATTSYGDNNQNYFEQEYRVEFQSVDDAEAVYSHWYTNAETGIRDSVCNVEYTYEFDGSTVILTPKQSAAGDGATVIRGVHTGGDRMLLLTEADGRTDSICTLSRTGDPEPVITAVDRTLPRPGDVVTVTGRNLQFVDHVYLPTTGGEIEVTGFTPGSRQITFTLPDADYAPGSIRMQATSAGVNCYSPAYMFCYDCVFFHNFISSGYSSPYTGSEFEYTISSMGTLKSNVSNLASGNLPDGHSLLQATGVSHPDSLLSLYGDAPIAWPVATKSDDKIGYLRFSSGDRFQYVLDNCNGLLTDRTPCSQAAIQMDIYVVSDGVPEWNTGYLSWRLNKDRSAIGTDMSADVAGWEREAPMSFADGWHTLTIPLTAFPVTSGSTSYSTLGGLVSQLKAGNLQTILTVVNFPLDAVHPAQALDTFQFNIADIRLVPYSTPANTKLE